MVSIVALLVYTHFGAFLALISYLVSLHPVNLTTSPYQGVMKLRVQKLTNLYFTTILRLDSNHHEMRPNVELFHEKRLNAFS